MVFYLAVAAHMYSSAPEVTHWWFQYLSVMLSFTDDLGCGVPGRLE